MGGVLVVVLGDCRGAMVGGGGGFGMECRGSVGVIAVSLPGTFR